MPVIVIDANIEGQCARIWMRLQSADWRELTTALDVTFHTLVELGLDPASTDDIIWRFCQANGHYLLTSNRNQEAEDSLERRFAEKELRRACRCSLYPIPTTCIKAIFWSASSKSCSIMSSTPITSAALDDCTCRSPD